MSKNRKSVQTFLGSFRPADETHEKAIGYFCLQKRLSVQINPKGGEQRHPVTYEQFKAWFEAELPGQGDVISFPDKGIIGIVDTTGIDSLDLSLSLKDGKLETHLLSVPSGDYREATPEECHLLQQALNREGLAWNRRFNKIIKRKVPVNNQRVQISLLGKKVGYGVFREIDNKGMIVMYILKRPGKAVRYSLYEVVGPAEDYQLDQINVSQSKEFISSMKNEGKTWNGFLRRVEPIDFRVGAGKNYWYISEEWEVRVTVESNRPKDQKRFKGGNYFHNAAQAGSVLDRLIEDRNRMLAEKD